MASARDRWRALPREVRESVVAWCEVQADAHAEMRPEDCYDPAEARRIFEMHTHAWKAAASLLRQAAREERK